MSVDASAIGGIGFGNTLPTHWEYYQEKGILPEWTGSDYGPDTDNVERALEKKFSGTGFRSTYGYEEPELYAFVKGNSLEELIQNAPQHVEDMKALGHQGELGALRLIVIPFFS